MRAHATSLRLGLAALIAGTLAVAARGEAPDRGARGVVVAVSPPAAEVGLTVLKQDGNAVDAAVATAFAMAVTWPAAGNIGGGGFMMIYPGPGKQPVCVEYRETAPAAATPTMLAGDMRMDGHRVCGVPGTVAGLALAHRRFGRLPWRDLATPAVRLAREGFTVDRALADSLNEVLEKAPQFEELQRVYKPPHGKPAWEPGDRLVQPELADTLEQIATGGPDAFYRGPIADRLVAEMRAGGGLITKQDLAAYQAHVRVPIHGTYRGYDVYGPPLPSSGGICLVEMLNMLENFPSQRFRTSDDPARWSAEGMHLAIEAMRAGVLRSRPVVGRCRLRIDPHAPDQQAVRPRAGRKDRSPASHAQRRPGRRDRAGPRVAPDHAFLRG